MMAIKRSFSAGAATSSALGALASSGSESGGVGMALQNHDQSPESPAKYRFFHIISTSRDRRRRRRSNPSHPYPIQPLQQSRELRRREPHHSIAQRRPAERALFQPLDRQNQARAVPEQQFHPIAAFGAEDIDHPAVGVCAQRLPNQRGQAIHAFAKVCRLHSDKNLHSQRGNDHDAPLRARTILANVAPSAVSGMRATIAPTTISSTAPSDGLGSRAGASNITGAKSGTAAAPSLPRSRAARRQPNNCCAEIPCRRATSDATAPAASVSSTIRAFSSDDHRRRR